MDYQLLVVNSGLVIGAIAAIRKRFPIIDGWMIYVLAISLGGIIGILSSTDIKQGILDGLKIAIGAIAGASGVQQLTSPKQLD